jgi:hypothetical protein
MVIKEITNNQKGYTVKLEQHEHLYVVRYYDKKDSILSPPVTDLTLALDLFNKLLDKEDKINYN